MYREELDNPDHIPAAFGTGRIRGKGYLKEVFEIDKYKKNKKKKGQEGDDMERSKEPDGMDELM